MIEKVRFQRFTAFDSLDLPVSPGVNVFIGENSTGKTHVLKAIYAACDVSKSEKRFADKVNNVFLPSGKQIGRLVKRSNKSTEGQLEVHRRIAGKTIQLRLTMSNHTMTADKAKVTGHPKSWKENPITSVYIPVKDMMANAPGFRSLYSLRNIHFEEVYADIIDRAFVPALKGPPDAARKSLLSMLQEAIDGKVISKNEEFFLKNKHGELEFTLLAEGLRKLGLLWVLIQNGTLLGGSVLLWDEPETNLNPRLMGKVISILLALQRMGVQVFVTTHDYVILKEFDLQTTQEDKVLYHALFRDKGTGEIQHASTGSFLELAPNAIDDTFGSLIDRQVSNDMEGLGK